MRSFQIIYITGCGAVGSALPWGGRGRWFKSSHSDQLNGDRMISVFSLYYKCFPTFCKSPAESISRCVFCTVLPLKKGWCKIWCKRNQKWYAGRVEATSLKISANCFWKSKKQNCLPGQSSFTKRSLVSISSRHMERCIRTNSQSGMSTITSSSSSTKAARISMDTANLCLQPQ